MSKDNPFVNVSKASLHPHLSQKNPELRFFKFCLCV